MNFFKRYLSVALFLLVLFNTSISVFAKVSPPAPPKKLIGAAVSTSQIKLSWSKVTGAKGYRVYMAMPNNYKYKLIGQTSGLSFINTKLIAGKTYWYYVTAYNSSGSSKPSMRIKVTTKSIVKANGPKKILGFATHYYPGDTSSYNSMVNHGSSINEIATATYTIDKYGKIYGEIPVSQLDYANKNNIKTALMISNDFNADIAKDLLGSPLNRHNLINNILLSLVKNGYKGVNLDFQGIYSRDRDNYTLFIKELHEVLHRMGYTLTVCVPAKTFDSPNYSWNYGYDYRTIGANSDSVVIMAYDEHYPSELPGPIASISYVRDVTSYAISVIPKEKLLLGIAAYGCDWSSNGTKTYSIDGIMDIASSNRAAIKLDPVSQSPYFNYTYKNGIEHYVWFENSTSIGYKLDIVNSLNLSGIAIWRLGLENKDVWNSISTKFNK